ncbi:MAG: carboxymuconolactone decarboxylase family protein [Rhodanobacteraceae bacterium]
MSAQFEKTSFTPVERQVVPLAISTENNCEFCVAAHSVVARQMVKVPGGRGRCVTHLLALARCEAGGAGRVHA